jgi:hypothetical protein
MKYLLRRRLSNDVTAAAVIVFWIIRRMMGFGKLERARKETVMRYLKVLYEVWGKSRTPSGRIIGALPCISSGCLENAWGETLVLWSPCSAFYFFGVFVQLWKTTISFIISVCPSVGMEKFGFHWAHFGEVWYLIIFRKSVEKIRVSLKSDKYNGYFKLKPIYIFYHISLSSS